MSGNNFPGMTNQEIENMQDRMLAVEENENDAIAIWFEPTANENIVFLNMGNVTINMQEQYLYRLTKLTQIAAKKLLNID